MAKNINLTSQEWCDIVFDEKNKAYGAYQIRRSSSKRNIIAIIFALLLTVFVTFLPMLIKTVVEATRRNASENLTESTVLADLKDMEEQSVQEKIVNQQEAPPPPLKSTIKFTPPVITDSKDMTENDGMKSQAELSDSKLQISIADVKGTDEAHGVDIADLEQNQAIVQVKEEKIYETVEQKPEFPGGEKELTTFLEKNTKYPIAAQEAGIQGTVYVKFVVNSKGEVDKVSIMRNIDPLLDAEALRVVKSMPKWIPGKINGKSVSSYFYVPIAYKLKPR